MTDVTGYGERVGRVLRKVSAGASVGFWCPGCDHPHYLRISPEAGRPCWGYNGNPDAPTFTPSILVTSPADPDPEWNIAATCCHSFVTDGQIQFLSDCTHSLAGQTVALPDFNR